MRLQLLSGAVLGFGMRHALRGVAATASEKASPLPGDDLVADATVAMDRAATFAATPEQVWPWLVQLGKGRGGWYFPSWLDAVTPSARRSLRRLEPRFQTLVAGDDHSDWGPGDPVLRVVAVDRERSIVYHSLRDRFDDQRWPRDNDPNRRGVFAMSWTITVRPVAGGSRLQLRVRARTKGRTFATIGDVFDGLTVALLVAGLRERIGS